MCLIMLQLRGAEIADQDKHFEPFTVAETGKIKEIVNFQLSI